MGAPLTGPTLRDRLYSPDAAGELFNGAGQRLADAPPWVDFADSQLASMEEDVRSGHKHELTELDRRMISKIRAERIALHGGDVQESFFARQIDQVDAMAADICYGDDLDRLPIPVPLISGLIDVGNLSMIYGPGGSGKSFAALDMACCVAAGIPWHGLATRRGSVLYVAAEGAHGLGKRRRAWLAAHPGADLSGLAVKPSGVDLFGKADPGAVAGLVELCRLDGTGWVVFDTYNRCTPGLGENDAKDAGIVLSNLGKFRDAGIAVTVIHHTPRDGDNPRGATALEWSTDHGLLITRHKGSGVITLLNARQKDREDGQRMCFTLVGEQSSGSGYLVDTAAAGPADDDAPFDPDDVRPIGDELMIYKGKGEGAVADLAQFMAQRAPAGSVGRSRAEAVTALPLHSRNTVTSAWDALFAAGALSPADGTRSPTSRAVWEPPGPGRATLRVNRVLHS